MKKKMVTITKEEYNSLKSDSLMLACLENAGVDNWGGYSYAMELLHEAELEAAEEEKCV